MVMMWLKKIKKAIDYRLFLHFFGGVFCSFVRSFLYIVLDLYVVVKYKPCSLVGILGRIAKW